MLKRMIAGALLLSLAVCALPAGADARAEAAAQAPVTSENAELFLPAGYEQYLPLDAPTDAAFSDAYIAVADGKSLYVYDRLAGEYACYTHSYSISKIGFAGDGTLYFSDIEAYLYSFDAQTMTAERTGANSSTFCIEGDSLYYAIVTAQTTRIGRYDMDDFSAPAEDLATIEAVSGTPRMTVFEGALLCAAGPVVYCYAPGSPATTFQLSKNPAEVTGVSSLCAYNGTLYYTAAGGLYRTNTDSECTLLCEGSDFSALTVFQDSLYCVKGASVLQTEIEGDGVAFTGYEICASSASLNRLGSGNAAVRADDRHADGQAQAHVAFAVSGRGFAVAERAVKQAGQLAGRDAAAVVPHGKDRLPPLAADRQVDLRGGFSVDRRIFQQVAQHLLDQDRVHRHKQQLVRHGDRDLDSWEPLAELACRFSEDLLGGLLLLGKLRVVIAHAGDGEQVFH